MTYIRQLLIALTIVVLCGCENKKDEHEQSEVARLTKILKEKRENALVNLEKDRRINEQSIVAELIDDALESKSRTKMVVLLSTIEEYEHKCFIRKEYVGMFERANAANRKEETEKIQANIESINT